MNKLIFLIAFIFPILSYSDLPKLKLGAGAKYEMSFQGQVADIAMAVVSSSSQRTDIEIYMSTMGTLQMWQRFHLKKASSGGLKVSDGYIYFKKLPRPQRLTDAYLRGYSDGAQMHDFLFADKRSIEKYKVSSGKVTVKAGQVKATQYRVLSNGQTVEFWISDEAKPLGLVKLISSGNKPKQNYSLEMTTLIKGVKAKIDPKRAEPLNKKGRSFLPKAGSGILIP